MGRTSQERPFPAWGKMELFFLGHFKSRLSNYAATHPGNFRENKTFYMLNKLTAEVCTLRKIPPYPRLRQVSFVKLLEVFMER